MTTRRGFLGVLAGALNVRRVSTAHHWTRGALTVWGDIHRGNLGLYVGFGAYHDTDPADGLHGSSRGFCFSFSSRYAKYVRAWWRGRSWLWRPLFRFEREHREPMFLVSP